ncbi:hypothetical protein CR513_06573, partial [Mucuna pruriens]
MDYDIRTRLPPYNASSAPTTHQMYPKIGPHGLAAARPSPHHHSSPPPSSPGLGIRVFVKPEYRITPPLASMMWFSQGSYQLVSEFSTMSLSSKKATWVVMPTLQCLCMTSQRTNVHPAHVGTGTAEHGGMLGSNCKPHLLPHSGDIPRSNFQFDFGLERKILAEANKENPNWSKFGMENLPTKVTESASPKVSVSDPIVSKYIAMGLNREAVPIAVAKYGDNPAKIPEFVKSYTLLREMGFSSTSVAEALVMYDNDTDKALAHFLNGSS